MKSQYLINTKITSPLDFKNLLLNKYRILIHPIQDCLVGKNLEMIIPLLISETVSFLLDNADDPNYVNITNHDGRTCLHIAALTDNLELCKILVNRGADYRALMKGKVRDVIKK